MKHTLRIGVCEKHPPDGIVSCRRVTVRGRMLRFFLGDTRKLMVIVPGNTVKTVSIFEEGGIPDEQNERT